GNVTATNGTVSGNASVTVVVGDVDSIIVTPNPTTVIVGEFLQFTATAYDVYNNPITTAVFLWSTDMGAVNATGYFTAQTTSAIGVVTVTSGSVSGSAVVEVVPGALDHVIVTPNPLSIIVNGVQQFTATAYDVYDNIITGVIFVWTTDVGSVDATGLFSAQSTPGTGAVTATNGTVSGNASVDVVDVTVDYILVTPDPGTVVAGGTQLFTATAYDALNNVISGVGFVWATDVGTIDASGLLTAQTAAGVGTVTATNGTISGNATVIIIPEAVDLIVIIPDPVSVMAGGSLSFTAFAFDIYGNVINGAEYNWTTNVGTIDSTGFFTAQTSTGIGIVSASNGSAICNVDVEVIPGPLDHIIVSPDPVSVTVGDSLQFTAAAYDVYSNVISGVEFVWTTDVGTVDVTGLFTAQTTPGSGTVTATNGTVSDSAIIDVVVGALDHILVTPDPVNVAVGDTQPFSAVAYDMHNNVISGVGFDWTTDVGSADATGLFTAQTTPAVGTVTATNGTIDYSATVTVIPGPVDHIVVTPDPATLTVGHTQMFSASAYDVYFNLLPCVEFVWTTDVGSVDATGLFTAQTIPGTGVVTATNGTVSGNASVTVVIGDVDSIIV
ncbi:MAG: Ig-like domain-containing protein, partial [Thermoplasmata archaeon]|nr:Ig-like domain-containing protein [Thermoplasmata archaeon]